MSRECKRQSALTREYQFCYNMARAEFFSPEQRDQYAKECERITAQALRQKRTARIMRDPFFLQAERAARAALGEKE